MTPWTRGPESTVLRFEKRSDNQMEQELEIEVFDHGGADIRLFEDPQGGRGSEVTEELSFHSSVEAFNYARENWGLDTDPTSNGSTIRVKRLVLSLLADYVGSDVVFGHDVPAETRDALAAAYEALDEPGIPLTFHDCPRDGAALDPLPDDPELPSNFDLLECPECGEEYLLNRETGKLEINE